MGDREFWLIIRAALIQMAKAIEKRWLCEKPSPNVIQVIEVSMPVGFIGTVQGGTITPDK